MLPLLSECIQEIEHRIPEVHLKEDLYLGGDRFNISEDDFPEGSCMIYGTYPIGGYQKTRYYIALRYRAQREVDGIYRNRLMVISSPFGDEIFLDKDWAWRDMMRYMMERHSSRRSPPFWDEKHGEFCTPIFRKEMEHDHEMLQRLMVLLPLSEETREWLDAYRQDQDIKKGGKTYRRARNSTCSDAIRLLHYLLKTNQPLEVMEFKTPHYYLKKQEVMDVEWWNKPKHRLVAQLFSTTIRSDR